MKKSLKWLFATMFVLCLFVIAMPLGASAAELPSEETAEPLAFPQWTPVYIAMQHNGSFLAPNLSVSSTLSAYRHNDTRPMYWVFRSVGTINGEQMFTIHPSSNSSYALTVNPSTKAVTLQPYQANNNLQYWYQYEMLTGDYIVSGATTTTAYQKRLKITTYADSATASVESYTMYGGTLFAFFTNYVSPMGNFGNGILSITTPFVNEYVIDTDALYPSGTAPVSGNGKTSCLWCTYALIYEDNSEIAADLDTINGVIEPLYRGTITVRVTDKISGAFINLEIIFE